MYEIVRAGSYRRDYRLAVKQGKDIQRLEKVIDLLASGEPMPAEYLDHPLKGNYKGFRECHIAPDWLLVYKKRQEHTGASTNQNGDTFRDIRRITNIIARKPLPIPRAAFFVRGVGGALGRGTGKPDAGLFVCVHRATP